MDEGCYVILKYWVFINTITSMRKNAIQYALMDKATKCGYLKLTINISSYLHSHTHTIHRLNCVQHDVQYSVVQTIDSGCNESSKWHTVWDIQGSSSLEFIWIGCNMYCTSFITIDWLPIWRWQLLSFTCRERKNMGEWEHMCSTCSVSMVNLHPNNSLRRFTFDVFPPPPPS